MDEYLDDLTVLFSSAEEFPRSTASRHGEGLGGATTLRSPTPEDTLATLEDHDVDCVVLDEAVGDDPTGLLRRLRSAHPDLPVVVVVHRPTTADHLAVGDEGYTEVLWRHSGVTPLEELSVRVARAVAASRDGPVDARGNRRWKRRDKIEALHGAATDIAACHEEAAVYEETVSAAERILEFDVCCTMIHEDGMLRPKAVSSGAPADGARPMQIDEGEAGYVYRTGESRVTTDSTEDDLAEPAKATYRASLSVPIGDVGVFQAVSTDTGAFTESDREVAELLVSHTTTALERIRFREVLQTERDRFRALIEHSSDLVTVLDRDGTIQYQSPSLEHLFGYDPEKAVGDDVYEYIHPEDRGRVRARFEQMIEDAEADAGFSVEYRVRHSDGDWRVVESNGTDHLDDPAVEGFVVNSRDVTERKERLRILEELPAAAGELRAAETATAVAEITVSTARDVLELPITGMWLHEDDALRPAAYTRRSAELFGEHPTFTAHGHSLSWEAFETGEARIYDDVRDEGRVHNDETPVRSEMIFPLGRYGVINVGTIERESFSDVDVYFAHILAATAESALERIDHEGTLRTQQRELERQNDRLDAFASLVSHDLRNPLGVAKGYADLLGAAETVDEAAEFGAEIESALDRMETLVEDVLAIARDGRTVRSTDRVTLSEVAASAWQTVQTGAAVLEMESDATILADVDRLRRLLENLMRNAVEHGDADCVRTGTLETDDGVSGFFVADDGPGIPPANRERVFETEFTTESSGTGFGLSIVQQIADGHGWTVSVTEGSSGGARFEVTGVETI